MYIRLLKSAGLALLAGLAAVAVLVGCWMAWSYFVSRHQGMSHALVAINLNSIAVNLTFAIVFALVFLVLYGRQARQAGKR